MEADSVRSAAADARDQFGFYAVSVMLALDVSVEELCRREWQLALYRRVRLSTVGRVRSARFALLPSFERPHYSIVLPDLADATLATLDACFDPPISNPGRA